MACDKAQKILIISPEKKKGLSQAQAVDDSYRKPHEKSSSWVKTFRCVLLSKRP